MKRLQRILLATLFFISLPVLAQNYTKVTYIHSDADGTPFAATDERGNLEWKKDHYPYGDEYRNSEIGRHGDVGFAGKAYDDEIGLSYFGARWYDPASGRFTGVDPMPVNPDDYRTFNRYAYGFNNPHKYVDPDGNLPILVPLVVFIAKEVAAEGASRATDGLSDFLSVRKLGAAAIGAGARALRRDAATNSGNNVDVYRGVPAKHPGLAEAKLGNATPRGGHSSPARHNEFDTKSEFTSWTTDSKVAERFANTQGSGGVVLKQSVDRSSLIRSPDVYKESEVLRRGPVSGASVNKQ